MQEVRAHSGLDDSSLAPVIYELESAALAFDTLTREERILFIPQDIFLRLKPIESIPQHGHRVTRSPLFQKILCHQPFVPARWRSHTI